MRYLKYILFTVLVLCGFVQAADTTVVTTVVSVDTLKKSEKATANEASNWQNSHAIGFGAGLLTGVGMNYTYWGDNNGIQVTLIPVYTTDNYSTKKYLSVSVIGLHSLWASSPYTGWFGTMTNNLHTYYGASLFYDKTIDKQYVYGNNETKRLTVGTGMAMDFNWSHIRWKLGAGYTYSHKDETYLDYDNKTINNPQISFIPTAEINLQYTFKLTDK